MRNGRCTMYDSSTKKTKMPMFLAWIVAWLSPTTSLQQWQQPPSTIHRPAYGPCIYCWPLMAFFNVIYSAIGLYLNNQTLYTDGHRILYSWTHPFQNAGNPLVLVR